MNDNQDNKDKNIDNKDNKDSSKQVVKQTIPSKGESTTQVYGKEHDCAVPDEENKKQEETKK